MPTKFTKIVIDGTDLPNDATHHKAVRVEHELLARPLIVTAFRSGERHNWESAKKFAEGLTLIGLWSWPLAVALFVLIHISSAALLGTKFGWRFATIQIVSLDLTVAGLFVCGYLVLRNKFELRDGKWHWPVWAWIWDNEEDGVTGPWIATSWNAFKWSALRNPADNLRLVGWVNRKGGPRYLRTWTGWYFQAGWDDRGYPVLSFGRTG